jgi:hypothetical protein
MRFQNDWPDDYDYPDWIGAEIEVAEARLQETTEDLWPKDPIPMTSGGLPDEELRIRIVGPEEGDPDFTRDLGRSHLYHDRLINYWVFEEGLTFADAEDLYRTSKEGSIAYVQDRLEDLANASWRPLAKWIVEKVSTVLK